MRRLPKPGLIAKFALSSLVLIVLLGVVLARVVGSDVRDRNLKSAREAAVLGSRLGVQPQLSPEMLAWGLAAPVRAGLDRELHNGVLGRSVTRVKIWNRAGRVIYSDDSRLVGHHYPASSELREALKGHVAAEVSTLGKDENVDERKAGKLLEVYVPIVFSGSSRPAGAFEMYLPYAPIAAVIDHDTRKLYLLLAAGLGLLWLVLFRIVWGASRRLRRQARENTHQALHDSLTGLPNRLLFRDRVDHAILAARRSRSGLAIVLMDLDRFREINDTLGHLSGDLLLRGIGARLGATVRASDTVARLGGDEFAVLLPGIADRAAALGVAEKLLRALDEPFQLDRLAVEIEASIGIAIWPEHGDDAASLLQHADVAMYVAKDVYPSIEVYASDHDQYSRDRLALLGDLRRAIENEELVLHYQPKVDLRTDGVAGVEALVRWQHPKRGLVPPDEFVPLAERTGLIRPLTAYVLERAAAQCATWQRAGLALGVSVNLSARNLHDVDLPGDVARVLRRHALAPSALELEITESAIMAYPARAMAVAEHLREVGIGLSIDDFGTGYSSLSYLKALPIREIKIDKSFVIDMSHNDGDAAIVRSTIGLAHNLGIAVVAEGVETQEVSDRLAELGCDLAQGYVFCRPVPADELAAWCRARSSERVRLAAIP